MPSPCPYPNANEIHGHAGNEPDVFRIFHRAPELAEFESAQGKPNKKDADQHPEPKLPSFHVADFIMVKDLIGFREAHLSGLCEVL